MKTNFILLFLFTMFLGLNAQENVTVDFENGLPDGWTMDGGWKIGTNASLSSQYFKFNGNDTHFAGLNDDAAGANGHADGRLTTAMIDMTNVDNVIVYFDLYWYHGNYKDKGQETLTIYYSIEGAEWKKLEEIVDPYIWTRYHYVSSDVLANKKFQLAIEYKDGNNWNFGAGVDNMYIGAQQDYYVYMKGIAKRYAQMIEPDDTVTFDYQIDYYGIKELTNYKFVYKLNDGDEQTIVGDSTLKSGDSYNFTIPVFAHGNYNLNGKLIVNDTTEVVFDEVRLSVFPNVPPYVHKDVDGVEHDIYADLSAGKVVVIDFFASWCGPCQGSTPILNGIWEKYGSGEGDMQVYGMTVEKSDDDAKVRGLNWGGEYPAFGYNKDNGLFWTLYNSRYGENSIPFFVVICPNVEHPEYSSIIWTQVGAGSLETNIDNSIEECASSVVTKVEFTEESVTVSGKTGEGNETEVEIELKNNTNEQVDVYWRLEKPEFDKDWESQLCDANLCYGRNKDRCSPNKPNSLDGGATQKWSFHFFNNNVPGQGKAVLKIYSDNEFSQLLDTLVINIDIANSINDILDSEEISVYPVPAKDVLNIKMNFKKAANAEIFMTDNLGRIVKNISSLHQKNYYSSKVDVSDLKNGIYFLNIKTEEGVVTKKVFKF